MLYATLVTSGCPAREAPSDPSLLNKARNKTLNMPAMQQNCQQQQGEVGAWRQRLVGEVCLSLLQAAFSPSGIPYTWYFHLHTCIYMVCKLMSNAVVCTYTIHGMHWYVNILKCAYTHVHGTYLAKYIHVWTWYLWKITLERLT